MATKKKIVRRKDIKKVEKGQCHIHTSQNNTIVTFTDLNGNVISWGTAGKCGFKGSKKNTAFAAQAAAEDAAKKAKDHGMKTVEVYVKGPGQGRESAIRAMETSGFEVTLIKDVSGIAHNGCRPPKRRRL